MRTEGEYAELFLRTLGPGLLPKEEAEVLAKNYWSDLTSHLRKYFSHDDREKITILAAKKLYEKTWPEVVRDFLGNNYWGFVPTVSKPEKKSTEEQKIFWKLFKYAWAFFQSMIILKIAVYYFGLESAQNPEQTSVIWVWFFFFLSAGSLAFFAWRNWKDSD